MRTLHHLLAYLSCSVGMLTLFTVSTAQRAPAGVPLDVHQGVARTDRTGLTFCVDQREPDWQLHQDIAVLIAEALLLEPRFFHFGPELADRVEDVEGMPDNLLFVLLDDHCDVFMGIRMNDRSVYPEFITTTRAYMQTGYVLASSEPDNLDIEYVKSIEGHKVGVSGDSAANVALAIFEPDVVRRVYAGERALLDGLITGEVTAAVFWEPALYGLLATTPAAPELHVSIAHTLPASRWEIGGGMMSRETFNRTAIDEAIEALLVDGSIDKVLQQHAFRNRVHFHE